MNGCERVTHRACLASTPFRSPRQPGLARASRPRARVLDERYELVAVSEPKREYLWVLSRTPVVDEVRYAALLTRLAAQGLDVGRLESTPQR